MESSQQESEDVVTSTSETVLSEQKPQSTADIASLQTSIGLGDVTTFDFDIYKYKRPNNYF
jgi:hypothetical protein